MVIQFWPLLERLCNLALPCFVCLKIPNTQLTNLLKCYKLKGAELSHSRCDRLFFLIVQHKNTGLQYMEFFRHIRKIIIAALL